MKRILFGISIIIGIGFGPRLYSQVLTDSNYSTLVSSITLYRSGIDQERPTMLLGSNDRLLLRFDWLDEEPTTFRYTFRHCDAEWQADEMEPYEYLQGFEEGIIDQYDPSINTLQHYYNYHQYLPTDGTTLQISGNYLLIVRLDDNPDSIVFTRRIQVTENLINGGNEVVRPTSGMRIMQDQEVNVWLAEKPDLEFGTYLPFTFSPTYLKVVLQQNGRTDNMRQLPFSGYCGGQLCYRWKDENCYAGGNPFRYFDISNMHATMYNVLRVEEYGGELFGMLRPEEDRSGKPYIGHEGLNGGMKVNVWDRNDPNTEADYIWVNFSLPMARPMLNGSIHVVGELTQWQLDSHSEMEWNQQYKAYTKRLLLKQGYYAYQLLFKPYGEQQGLTATLEGDHVETPNTYHLYVYYRFPGDRYDRLLLVR
ncbi:MAG: DUF5103 domain-containing protein [Bacteroidales bacterium]|nr:DUF5103 domain-containing protein [Candidatus Colimorpha onthohippi]